MDLSRLSADAVGHLKKDLQQIAWTHRGFPFHVVVSGYAGASGRESSSYKVSWCRSEHGFHEYACVSVTVEGVESGRLTCSMRAQRKKRHEGEVEESFFGSRSSYRQDWRFESLHAALDARLVWLMLETTCNWDKFYADIVEEVLGS